MFFFPLQQDMVVVLAKAVHMAPCRWTALCYSVVGQGGEQFPWSALSPHLNRHGFLDESVPPRRPGEEYNGQNYTRSFFKELSGFFVGHRPGINGII